MRFFIIIVLFGFSAIAWANQEPHCSSTEVPVAGFAQSFLFDKPIKHAKITVLETGKVITTDKKGKFQFCALPGSHITLILKKKSLLPWHNFKITQSGTFIVPKKGFIGKFNNISFQVPLMTTYRLFKIIITAGRHIKLDPKRCNVVTTISAYHKTLKDDPQGEPGANVLIRQKNGNLVATTRPFYFGIIKGQTNPFTPSLNKTSLDGGVLIYNLKVSNKPYVISAVKSKTKFNSKQFICRPGAFINVSPPQGPMVQKKLARTPSSHA